MPSTSGATDKMTRALDKLKQELLDFKAELSKYRKKGVDVKLINLKIMNLPSKVDVIELSDTSEGLHNLNQTLEKAKSELEEAKLKRVKQLISMISDFIKSADKDNAKFYYNELMELYALLGPKNKTKMKDACLDIRKKIITY